MVERPKRNAASNIDYRDRKRPLREPKLTIIQKGQETTIDHQAACLQLYEAISNLKDPEDDKRFLKTNFMELPPKEEHVDYYEIIKTPLSLNEISENIHEKSYAELDELKSDFDLMISNAKTYNKADAQIYKDAIKIENFLEKWEPANEKVILKLSKETTIQNLQGTTIKSIKLTTTEKKKKTPFELLMGAIKKSDLNTVMEILDANPTLDINQLLRVKMFDDNFKWGPLHSACYFGDIEICKVLLKRGADVELNDTWYSATPLGWATFGDNEKIAKLLIEEYNANKYAKNVHDQIPFELVSEPDDPKWVDIIGDTLNAIQIQNNTDSSSNNITISQYDGDHHQYLEDQSQQDANKKRRGRPPKSEIESMLAAQRPIHKIDLSQFDTAAFMIEIFNSLKNHTDNTNRHYSELFENLPDRKDYEDYYKVISKPISINIIEDMMRERRYKTVGEWYTDLILVFQNAMQYNENGSRVYKDAKLLLRLLNRLKDRSLFNKGVPENQEIEVMNLILTNRPFDPSGIKSKRYKNSESHNPQVHQRPPMGHPGQYPQHFSQQFPQQHPQSFPHSFPQQFPHPFQHPHSHPYRSPQHPQQQSQYVQHFPPQFPHQMQNNMYQHDRPLPQMPPPMPMMPMQGPSHPNMHPHLPQQPVPQAIPLGTNPPQHPSTLANNSPVPVMMNSNSNGFSHHGMQPIPMHMSGSPMSMPIPNPAISGPPQISSPSGSNTPPAPHSHYLNMMGPMNNMMYHQQHQMNPSPPMSQINPDTLQLLNEDRLRLLDILKISTKDDRYNIDLDGESTSHSIVIPLSIESIQLIPKLPKLFENISERVTIHVVHNSNNLLPQLQQNQNNMETEDNNNKDNSTMEKSPSPLWSTLLTQGMNLFKITIVINVTTPSSSQQDFRTQTYSIFVNQVS